MKLKKIIKNIVLATALAIPVSSCSDWLEVDMEDGILEEALYSDNEGFLTVLNGVYTNLNATYSSFLGMGALDVMAQYYNVQRNSAHPYYVYADYRYDDDKFDDASGAAWTKLYSLILNTNVLLEQCDKENAAISPKYYNIVKGEALALRAMMHFDMLRLYGPIYNEVNASQPAIPYLKDTERKMQEILPASKVIAYVLDDLKKASDLLKDDPARTDGINSSDAEDLRENNDFRYRQYRLNYYAVQGLLTRAYMWMGDKEKAYTTVSNLITEIEENETFPWATRTTIESTLPDRVFSTEVMFGLYNVNRNSLHRSLFDTSLEGNALTFVGGNSGEESKLESFYGDISKDDFRRKYLWESITESEKDPETGELQITKETTSFKKFADVETTEHYRYMIPLMRVSEMYLALAELTADKQEALSYINKVRLKRSVPDVVIAENVELTSELLQQYITEEFAREVIGEGQLFFYYKRHAMENFPAGTSVNATFNMNLTSYVVPLPTIETNNRD